MSRAPGVQSRFEVVSGSVRFSRGEDQRVVSAGELVALDRDIPHRVEASEESAFLSRRSSRRLSTV
jgi:quercetin dioxygenase-like cupin family protein